MNKPSQVLFPLLLASVAMQAKAPMKEVWGSFGRVMSNRQCLGVELNDNEKRLYVRRCLRRLPGVAAEKQFVNKLTLAWAGTFGIELQNTEKHKEHQLAVSAAGNMILATAGWTWPILEGFTAILNSEHNMCWTSAAESHITIRLSRGSTRVTCKYYICLTYATNVMEQSHIGP